MNPELTNWTGTLGLPRFDLISDQDFAPAFDTCLQLAGEAVEAIAANPEPPSFQNTVAALETAEDPLNRLCAVFYTLASVDSNPAREDLQRQIAPDKREAIGKQVEADVKKYVEEATPLVRERAIKLAPTTIGPILEEKFSEDELKQLIAWLESPINKKYAQIGPEMQTAFVQKLVVDARPVVDPKLQALDAKVRSTLGLPAPGTAASGAAASRPPSAPKSK